MMARLEAERRQQAAHLQGKRLFSVEDLFDGCIPSRITSLKAVRVVNLIRPIICGSRDAQFFAIPGKRVFLSLDHLRPSIYLFAHNDEFVLFPYAVGDEFPVAA